MPLLEAPPLRAALARIVDYAGLFPPAALTMERSVEEYKSERRGRRSWMLGRFVVPASRLAELETVLADQGAADRLPLAVIIDSSEPLPAGAHMEPQTCEAVLRFDREIGAIRTAVRALERSLSDRVCGLPVTVEIPPGVPSALMAEALDALGEARFTAKIRCGGATPEAVPSVETLAAFIDAAANARVAFKATAGLHHPVRRRDARAGTSMHGFLNVLAAACFAGRDRTTTVQILSEEDGSAFHFDEEAFSWRGYNATAGELAAARRDRFTAFGSCSFSEPVEDLIALGILPA